MLYAGKLASWPLMKRSRSKKDLGSSICSKCWGEIRVPNASRSLKSQKVWHHTEWSALPLRAKVNLISVGSASIRGRLETCKAAEILTVMEKSAMHKCWEAAVWKRSMGLQGFPLSESALIVLLKRNTLTNVVTWLAPQRNAKQQEQYLTNIASFVCDPGKVTNQKTVWLLPSKSEVIYIAFYLKLVPDKYLSECLYTSIFIFHIFLYVF
jgi:hypothetical protein